jgi:HlyD family secretion protein
VDLPNVDAIIDIPWPTCARDGGDWRAVAIVDLLHGLTVGATVEVRRSDAEAPTPAQITELVPLDSFATWQAERAVGDHDRNTLRLRLDPQRNPSSFEPGMTVWIKR